MSAVVMEPGTGAAPPGVRASSRRARSREASRSLSRLSSFCSSARRCSVVRAVRRSCDSRRARASTSSLNLLYSASRSSRRAVELLADVEQVVALLDHAVPELFDVAHQRAVLPAGEIEVLVPAQEVAERFGGEQGLEGVERAPLVDVHQPALQHRAALGEVVFREDELRAAPVEPAREAPDLALDLVHDLLGGLALALEDVELVVDVVDLALETLLLLLEPVALLADLLQPLAAALHLLGVLGVERRREQRRARAARHPERSEGSCPRRADPSRRSG